MIFAAFQLHYWHLPSWLRSRSLASLLTAERLSALA